MSQRRSARAIGIAVALATLALDQASKAWTVQALGDGHGIAVAPFLDLRLAWNTGISYSLFRAGNLGRWVFVALALVASGALAVWLWRAERRLLAPALGLLIGGALGNACDRVHYGAVADFVHVHLGGFTPWGVFNLADVAITFGVGVLLIDGVLTSRVATDKI